MTMKITFGNWKMAMGVAVILSALTVCLQAFDAPAPQGSWSGRTNGPAAVALNLTVQGGLCAYSDPYINLGGNSCSWQPTAANGGILTLYYDTYAGYNVFHNKVYIGITWVSRDQLIARAGPGDDGAATMYRR
jgi:hypothetical protein